MVTKLIFTEHCKTIWLKTTTYMILKIIATMPNIAVFINYGIYAVQRSLKRPVGSFKPAGPSR